MKNRWSRRDMLQLAAAGTSSLMVGPLAGCGSSDPPQDGVSPDAGEARFDFSAVSEAEGWGEAWTSLGVARLRTLAGEGLLEAGSDVFPNDPRPVAFVADARMGEGVVRAELTRIGAEAGVVLRRRSIRDYYTALYDTDRHRLALFRRTGFDLVELASVGVAPLAAPDPETGSTALLELSALGARPSLLLARLRGADGIDYEISAEDAAEPLQEPGEAGVLGRADTLLPDTTNPVLPALGNLRLLAFAVQEGQAVLETPAGQLLVLDRIRRRSTTGFRRIEMLSPDALSVSPATVVAATTGAPLAGGARLHVASDLPAEVVIEHAATPDLRDARRLAAGSTASEFLALHAVLDGLPPGTRYWRPRLKRQDAETAGPIRRFQVLPEAGSGEAVTLAYGACAARFGPIFDLLAAQAPDLWIWQGDLNYADTHGPLAQNVPGYAGIWRHFLDNPRLAEILASTAFLAVRDDHDYGVQDVNAATLVPWGITPWEALVNPETFQRVSAGLADIWVLDQRRFKSDPAMPDTVDKTLLGRKQRQWLFDGLAGSRAPFHIICSPATVAPDPSGNERDGSWANSFSAERELLLAHIAENVRGQTLFLTGDTHFTMVWEQPGLFEQRACPLDIPRPNDQNLVNPALELTFGSNPEVRYWSRLGHFSLLRVAAEAGEAVLDLRLLREDGALAHQTRFRAPL